MDNYKLKIDVRHLSTLSAIILLVNGISRLVEIPSRGIRLTMLDIQWVVSINGNLLFMLLLALIVIVGTETILRSHPALQPGGPAAGASTPVHWILPGLTAFGGSAAVNMFPPGPRWWLGLVLVTGLLILIILGEYSTIEKTGLRYDAASVGLNILGLTLLAVLLNAIHATTARLTFALPVIAVVAAAVAGRSLELLDPSAPNKRFFAAGIGLLISELALPLFYLPVSSVTFGLVLTLGANTAVGIAQIRPGDPKSRSVLLEYLLIDAIAVIVLLLLLGR